MQRGKLCRAKVYFINKPYLLLFKKPSAQTQCCSSTVFFICWLLTPAGSGNIMMDNILYWNIKAFSPEVMGGVQRPNSLYYVGLQLHHSLWLMTLSWCPPGVHFSWVSLLLCKFACQWCRWNTRWHLRWAVFWCYGDNLYNCEHNKTRNKHLGSHSGAGLCNCRVPREPVFVCNVFRRCLSVH